MCTIILVGPVELIKFQEMGTVTLHLWFLWIYLFVIFVIISAAYARYLRLIRIFWSLYLTALTLL